LPPAGAAGEEGHVWTITQKRWFVWDFAVRDDRGQEVGQVRLSAWRERGYVVAGGLEYRISRERAVGTSFVLEGAGSALARAEKRSAFRRAFAIAHGGNEYTLRARSAWRREMVLFDDEVEIGGVAPERAWGRRARADLPQGLPLEFKLFVVWLALVLWKRQERAAHSG
jgi:hypothetical protein